jgi:hypothetical protein
LLANCQQVRRNLLSWRNITIALIGPASSLIIVGDSRFLRFGFPFLSEGEAPVGMATWGAHLSPIVRWMEGQRVNERYRLISYRLYFLTVCELFHPA